MDWGKIRKEYEESNITLKDLAEKHNVKLGTLKSRKSREKWTRGATKKDATKKKKVATNKKEDATIEKTINNSHEVVVESGELTDKQRLFCIYYVKSFNATQSAIKAGYAPESAHVRGSELVRNSKVAEEIRRIKGKMTQDLFIDAMDVLHKYVKIAFADITDYVTFGKRKEPVIGIGGPVLDDEGEQVMKEVNYVDFNESAMVDGTIITEAKQGKDGVSIKLADKMKALDKLAEYFDLFPDNFKRKIEEEKLQITKERLEIEKNGVKGGDEELIDDWISAVTDDE
ncbi:terminase small subunit [Desertibacillus haloalkaliphilus]|uniref:terminase small subunit n=1 Tax=Desertibacillus haloalkaliphilus TaxID=1328930 RepID=UPI001C270FC9|nr:terminase small subunit [Desertibacillus haloalkaliphilus]MBU8908517.1 terminase small subunit [Desertibacillus haloalkaliphilus]